jgi:hypothetical protein
MSWLTQVMRTAIFRSVASPSPVVSISSQDVCTEILRAPRLTAPRRKLLIELELAISVQVALPNLTRDQITVRRRAAHALAGLGLVETFKAHGTNSWGSRCPGMVHARLTDKGRKVLDTFRRDFELGRQTRWSKFAKHEQRAVA